MTYISPPVELNAEYARLLCSNKADFIATSGEHSTVSQFGAAQIQEITGDIWPGWPANLMSDEPVFETYVVGTGGIDATSDNQPFVDTWLPLVRWFSVQVQSALGRHDVYFDGDAYVTASLSSSAVLEGAPHQDDDSFAPDDTVGAVAIIGQHVGPRVATAPLQVPALRPMSQVTFDSETIGDFSHDRIDHCQAAPDEIVIFPQFGQLHAGPATQHLAAVDSRQLLVLRAKVREGEGEL